MEVKEAIEFIKKEKFPINTWDEMSPKFYPMRDHNKKLDDIISLLQQGEKDKEELKKVWQMWEELFETSHDGGHEFEDKDVRYHVASLMKNIKQKYFPKEERK